MVQYFANIAFKSVLIATKRGTTFACPLLFRSTFLAAKSLHRVRKQEIKTAKAKATVGGVWLHSQADVKNWVWE